MANSKDNISKYATSYFSFDESSGNVYDSVGGYTGTIYNSPTRVEGWNGQGSAMSFNGSNQYVSFNNKIVPIGAKSIRIKIKISSLPSVAGTIFTNTVGTTQNGDILYITKTGNILWSSTRGVSGSSRFEITSTKLLNDGQWHDVCLTWDGTTNVNGVKMYIDDMTTPNVTSTALSIETTVQSNNLILGKDAGASGYYLNGQIDQIEIYDKVISPIPDKHLILHNSQYKYHNGTEWLTITNTETNFIQYGMNDLSHITENQWKELVGDKSIAVWSDFEDKQYVSAVLQKEPFTTKDLLGDEPQIVYYTNSDADQVIINTETDVFSVYDYISETPEINIYTEATSDVVVSTATEPYDLYDEFGDEVEILTYTDNEDATAANLIIEANWSPIDELDGEFEVVTWTDETTESTTRELTMTALPKEQFIVPITNNLHYGITKAFEASIAPISSDSNLVRFLFSFDEGATWMSYENSEWLSVSVSDKYEIRNRGMKFEELNALTDEELLSNSYKIGYYLEDRDWVGEGIGVNEITIKDDAYINDIKISSLLFFVVNTLASISASISGNKIIGEISDEDLGKVQYRVRLNGEYIYPEDGIYTPLYDTPLNFDTVTIDARKVRIGANNTIQVEFRDGWGYVKSWTTSFIGKPVGLVFSTPSGQYYSSAFGEILRYLDFQTMIAGQTTLEEQVVLSNTLPFTVKNIILTSETEAIGVDVELSKTNNPFIPQEGLIYGDELEADGSVNFYVRLKLNENAVGSHLFDINASADPA